MLKDLLALVRFSSGGNRLGVLFGTIPEDLDVMMVAAEISDKPLFKRSDDNVLVNNVA